MSTVQIIVQLVTALFGGGLQSASKLEDFGDDHKHLFRLLWNTYHDKIGGVKCVKLARNEAGKFEVTGSFEFGNAERHLLGTFLQVGGFGKRYCRKEARLGMRLHRNGVVVNPEVCWNARNIFFCITLFDQQLTDI